MTDSVQLDWIPIQQDPTLEAIAEEITASILNKSNASSRGASRADRQKRIKNIAHLLVSSLHFTLTSPKKGLGVSLPLTARYYSATDPNKINLSHDSLMLVYRELEDRKWISVKKGEVGKKLTVIKPIGLLKTNLEKIGLKWMQQGLLDQCIELRDVKRDGAGKPIRRKVGKKFKTTKIKLPLPQRESPELAQQRANLLKINSFLTQHCVTLDLDDDQLLETAKVRSEQDGEEQGYILDPRRVQLTRVFSRGNLGYGGRFYGGWWQGVPEVHRPHLRIDGYKTVEADFSAMAVHIIYSLLGSSYNETGCPYDIFGDCQSDAEWQNDPRRKVVKKIFNAYINDIDGVYKVSQRQLKQLKLTERELLNKFKNKHPLIVEQFGTDIGLRGQCIDSQIAEQVMLTLLEDGIVALPIHDSFVVRSGFYSHLEATMKDRFFNVTGSKANISLGIVKNNNHFGLTEQEVLQQQNAYSAELELRIENSSLNELENGSDHLDIVSGKDTFDLIFNENQAIMNKYLSSFELARQG